MKDGKRSRLMEKLNLSYFVLNFTTDVFKVIFQCYEVFCFAVDGVAYAA